MISERVREFYTGIAFEILKRGDPLPLDLETDLMVMGVDVAALRELATLE